MKKFIIFIILFATFSFYSNAQFNPKSFEISSYISFGNYKSGGTFYGQTQTYSRDYLMLSVLPGIYIAEGFSIEPEIGIVSMEHTKPGFLLLLNGAYTYRIPTTRLAPFARIGYGVSNCVGYQNSIYMGKSSNAMDIHIINLGIGVKFLVSDKACFRTEINYRKFNFDNSRYDEYDRFISFLFGVSLLIN